ncbi:MAG: metallophosphoesterase [Chloroflexales bacterium]|nr:metallophosphoesterase [Chloroflexales bacterium]
MQILTISDEVVPAIYSLNIKQRYPDVGLILGCGDLPYYYIEFVVSMLNVPCFYIHGNHDTPEIHENGVEVNEARGAVCLEGWGVRHEGLLIAGLGGCLRYRPDGTNMYSDAEMMRRAWRLVPWMLFNHYRYGRYLDLLITHAPPLGIHNGPDYPHRGFKAFLWLMDRFRPRYLIHGHIHLSYGYAGSVESVYGHTTVINTAGHRLLEIAPQENLTKS